MAKSPRTPWSESCRVTPSGARPLKRDCAILRPWEAVRLPSPFGSGEGPEEGRFLGLIAYPAVLTWRDLEIQFETGTRTGTGLGVGEGGVP
jgi:hypothetical protein